GRDSYPILTTLDAAPSVAVQYAIGGTLIYTEAVGTTINVPLLPAQITVEPSPNLVLNYFWQQQVEGQNAVTPAIVQPSVPFPLGVEVTNIGHGPADNFSITTAQPKIVENAQGLQVGFNILGTTVNGQPASPTLTANFGNIDPGATGTAAFIMTSTLAGDFENFSATYQHDNALGGAATSLINSVSIHNLVHMTETGYVGNPATIPATGVQDFLVSDLPGSLGRPDTLYLSQGTTAPVAPGGNVQVQQLSADVYQITADMPAGWGYLELRDPTGGNLNVSQVGRTDGLFLRVGDDVWNTVQNITSSGFVTAENDLHLLDYNAAGGTVTYTVTYVNPNAVTPQIAQLQAVKPSTVNTPVDALDVTFNEPINLATFTAANVTLSSGHLAVPISGGLNIALVSGSTYRISGLAPSTAVDGPYTLTVSALGVEDDLGDTGIGSESVSWTMDSTATVVTVPNVAPTLRNAPVTEIPVVFSGQINQPTFTLSDLSLTLDGGPNLITASSGVTIENTSGGSYDIKLPASLTTAEGNYVFSAVTTGILDANGNPVAGGDSTAWTMDTTAPAITSVQQPQTPRNIVVPTLTVTFSKPIDPTTFTPSSLTLTRTVGGVTTANLLDGRVTISPDTELLAPPNTYVISGINWPQSIQGTYTFTIGNATIADLAGNPLAGPASTSWVLDLATPAAPSHLAISPDLGPNPVGGQPSELTNTQDVTFSGQVDASTVEVRLQDLTTSTYLGDAFLSSQSFSRTLHLSPGLHELSAQAFDAAANGSPVSTYYVFVDMAPPAVVSLTPVVPNPPTTPLNTEIVVLNKTVQTFDFTALTLTLNGNPVALDSSVTVSPVSGAAVPTYQISGLAPFTTATGAYVLTVNAGKIVDYAGNAGLGTAAVTWNEVQSIADLSISNTVDNPKPHEGGQVQFTVTLNDTGPANATNVTVLDDLPSGLTLVSASGPGTYNTTTGVWSIGQVTVGTPATLTLIATVNLGTAGQTLKTVASITGLDQTNNNTPTSAEQDVTVLSSAAPPTGLAISPDTGTSGTDGITDKGSLTLTGTLATAGTAVDVFDTSTNTDLGQATVSGTSFSRSMTLAEGVHVLRVRAQLNGTSADASFTVQVDLTAPTSHVVNTLPTSEGTDSFPVSVAYTDPAGAGGSTPSGVASVDLYVSTNNGPFAFYQNLTVPASPASGSVTFTFNGQDRNIYAFHSVAHDVAGNTESKAASTIEATTSVPDLNPPVTHVLAASPTYSWGPYSSSLFGGRTPSSYSNGVFTLNWAGADPDRSSGTPAGSITVVDVYVEVDGGSPALVAQLNAGTPNSNGVYSGTTTYNALGDGLTHSYSFFSVGVDDQQKSQYAPQSGPASPDVTFSSVAYTAPLAVQGLTVEKGIAERSYIRYLDVSFNQSLTSTPPSSALQALASGLSSSPNSYVELLWYGENLNSASVPAGSVNLFNASTATVSLSGNDLSIDFGSKGITSLLTETGVTGTGSPMTSFGDGWYALGIDPSGNPSTGPVFWTTFYRLLGDTNGDGVVTGPYTTAGTDAYTVYHAEGETGTLLNADVNGDGAVNSKDLTETVLARGHAVGTRAPANFPAFQLLAGVAAPTAPAPSPITQGQVQVLLPRAIAAWNAAGLDAADVRRLSTVPVRVGDLGTSILGLEAAGTIEINSTAAGYSWTTGPAPVAGGVDLLTVLEHELGHVLGLLDNATAGDLMDTTLTPGVSRSPSPADVAAITAEQAPANTSSGAYTTTIVAPGMPGPVVTDAPIASAESVGSGPSPGIAAVTVATLDTALTSILGRTGDDGDGANAARREAVAGPAGRRRGTAGTANAKGRRSGQEVQHPRGPLISLFRATLRRPGSPPAAGTPTLEPNRGA
ncbi:MAG: hypothetical protein ACYC61_05585, partial [Isosphaeraceae bacterium]